MKGLRIRLTGTVQGVGMRPYIYNLAVRFGIHGSVRNDLSGVTLLAAGRNVNLFVNELKNTPPPLARITAFTEEPADITETDFIIEHSLSDGMRSADIGIDSAVCPDCLQELFDPGNRRHLYPFINCTHCGPRYTIMTGLPFDRANTTLAPFPMCPDCLREYQDPANRRFHTQGNCCPVCGPVYEGIDLAVQTLEQGGIAAIKGIGGYHLACDADNAKAVQRLRERKHRDEKPFALMVRDDTGVNVSDTEKRLLNSLERPIVLLDAPSPGPAAPGLNTLGIMLPYAPIHHILFAKGRFKRLIMTSGNRTSEPMAVGNGREVFKETADFVLEHNREIAIRNDDSVLRVMNGAPLFLRRSRGFAPGPVAVKFDATGLLGCGAMLKNTLALGRGREVLLSHYIGDLQNIETYYALVSTADHLCRLFGMTPEQAVCDLHPDYLSTRFAESLGVPVVKIQHHRAHAWACMAEHGLTEAIAAVFDGTGYGDDGFAWGGEIFALSPSCRTREAHLSYMPMPGGDACVEFPLRLAAAVLHSQGITLPGQEPVIQLLEKKVNLHYTSGMGRLFDAASALLGLCLHQSYEGQAPMMLEAACAPLDGAGAYETDGLDSGQMLSALYRDTAPAAVRAARFHNTVIEAAAREIRRIAAETGIRGVCLTGGCFQNRLLLEGLTRALKDPILVYTHRLVPPNDGGIALGQIAGALQER